MVSFIGFAKEAAEADVRINKWMGGETEAIHLITNRVAEERQVRADFRTILEPSFTSCDC